MARMWPYPQTANTCGQQGMSQRPWCPSLPSLNGSYYKGQQAPQCETILSRRQSGLLGMAQQSTKHRTTVVDKQVQPSPAGDGANNTVSIHNPPDWTARPWHPIVPPIPGRVRQGLDWWPGKASHLHIRYRTVGWQEGPAVLVEMVTPGRALQSFELTGITRGPSYY